jgi:two-component system, chemotaxis family, protein-glutamate methylesterase/glutaminase
LTRLVAQIPEDFRAPIFVVRHGAPDARVDVLVAELNKHGKLRCKIGRHHEAFAPGRIYVPPADHHIMIAKGRILVTKGAQENRARPAIDPLFRSAAVAYGNRAIAVVLTGYLDDGTAGLLTVKRCGGICVVQDPDDATYPDMPRNALRQVDVDHCVPVSQMGSLLTVLARGPFGKRAPIPNDIAIEAKIAERVLSDLPSVNKLGEQAPFNCPGCGGVLWQVGSGKSLRFRCHVGHAYTAPVLLSDQSEKIEETLWVALRMFEERRNLLLRMKASKSVGGVTAASERIKDSEIHIDRIKAMLKANQKIVG